MFLDVPGVGVVHINTRGCEKDPCDFCSSPKEFRCDFEISPGTRCSKKICWHHRTPVWLKQDYCPMHADEGLGKAKKEKPEKARKAA